MLRKSKFLALAVLMLAFGALVMVAVAQDDQAPLVLQDFEGDVTLEDVYQATATIGDVVQSGEGSLSDVSTEGEWHTVGASFIGAPVDISGYDQLCFAIHDTTAAGSTVGVKLFDESGVSMEKWTDHEGVGTNPTTASNEWVTMCLNLATYTDIDLTAVTKVEFAMFAAGTYYFDDIVAQMGGEEAEATPEGTPEAEDENLVLNLTVVQDFENVDTPEDVVYSNYQADVSIGDVAFSGTGSLMAASEEGEWHAFGAFLSGAPVDASEYDVVCFQIYDTTALNDGLADNTVGVRLFDGRAIDQEAWTDHVGAGDNPKTVTNEWVQMCISLDLYANLDLTQLEKIQFALFYAGTYYIDDVAFGKWEPAAAVETIAQDFENVETPDEVVYSNYQADVSIGDVAHSGTGSLMAASEEGEWHAFGAFLNDAPFDASTYDQVCFWIYDTTALNEGLADNTVGVRLFDGRAIDQEAWTDHVGAGDNPKTVTNEWVQMCINLDLYANLDLTQLEKIQFALFHPGTYYIDDVSFVSGGE